MGLGEQISVMAVNYKGRPFMISAFENRPMIYSLLACAAIIATAAFEVVPELNSKLGLVTRTDHAALRFPPLHHHAMNALCTSACTLF